MGGVDLGGKVQDQTDRASEKESREGGGGAEVREERMNDE
jgi:hypothetical protein